MINTNHVKAEDHSIELEENSNLELPSLDDHVEIMQRGNRHWAEKSLHEMTQRDWLILKSDHNKGESAPHPLRSWDDLTVPSFIRELIDKSGYKIPTPIQMQTIPIALQNRDVLGVAEAGSGKTVAYLVALFAWIHGLPKCEMMGKSTKAPDAIILTPTRLVAQHVKEECDKFGEVSGIRTATVIGGVNYKEQTNKLDSGCEIVVSTPGRLLYVLEKGSLVLNQRTCVVMDEVDVMVEFGFESDLRKILDILQGMPETEGREENAKKCHQTVMFTSTMPPTVERLACTFLYDPCVVQVRFNSHPR
ncbi:probable ATP-dependent RNA helicase DDX23 [Haliotis rubra]|uniref:probable ATP-dependent RNA helicase DDX23 n=1 Tax=Haliotis rubra TaxID=36100 RepID=UPI001EE5CBAE|nr:probable ATP-dependent RNA helicase DDX23 [Haliotis rubra]